jgi:N-acetylglucosamine transport system substrate-binding protein
MIKRMKLLTIILVVALVIASLSACQSNTGNQENKGQSPTSSEEAATAPTIAVYEENGLPKEEKVILKVGFFEAGMGREWFDNAMASFKQKFPNVSFEVTYSPKIADVISTKIAANKDEDMFDIFSPVLPGGASAQIPLVEANKLESQEDLWDRAAFDGNGKTLKDLSIPGEFEGSPRVLGNTYALPNSVTTTGLFYNKNLFEQHGWNQNPNTWSEFLQLGEDIKSKGIVPISTPGQFPDYLSYAFGPWKLFELAEIKGNLEQFESDFRNFRNEYTSPESIERWNKVYELGKLKFFPEGLAALNHTQAQMQVLQEKAAMVTSGNWVGNEMKDSTPENFKWGFMAVPMSDNPQSTKWIRGSVSNGFFIWAAKPELNKKWAKEFVVWLWNMDVQTDIADKGGQLSVRNDFADDPSRLDIIQDASKAVNEYLANNNVTMLSAFRNITLTDPTFSQSVKVINEAVSQIASGKQEPLPILEEAQELIDKAIKAEEK